MTIQTAAHILRVYNEYRRGDHESCDPPFTAKAIGEAITNAAITRAMKGAGYQLNEARVRKIINHIRTAGLIKWLIATSKGYYIATSRQEMEDYIGSLRGRELAIRAVRESMEKQLN